MAIYTRAFFVLVLSFVLLIPIYCMANEQESYAYKLAAVNAGTSISQSHPTVREFQQILNRLTRKFSGESEMSISDVFVFCWKDLRKNGINKKLIWVARELDTLMKGAGTGADFKRLATAWLINVEKNH